jgi:hypothetical protein
LAIGEGHFDAALANTYVVAQKILQDKRGDLLIWGRVKSANVLALYFRFPSLPWTSRSTEGFRPS